MCIFMESYGLEKNASQICFACCFFAPSTYIVAKSTMIYKLKTFIHLCRLTTAVKKFTTFATIKKVV